MTLVYKKYKCKTLVHKKYKCITLVYYQYIYTIHITIVYDWKGITLVYKTLLSSKDSAQLFTIIFPYKVMLTGIHQ